MLTKPKPDGLTYILSEYKNVAAKSNVLLNLKFG